MIRADWKIYKTGGGGGDAPDPPPDPSIAQEKARREAVALAQAYQRRQSRYGIAQTDVKDTDRRPGTGTILTGSKTPEDILAANLADAQANAKSYTQSGELIDDEMAARSPIASLFGKINDPNLRAAQDAYKNMTPEQIARTKATKRDSAVERLIQRRETRVGVSTTLGGGKK